MNPTRPTTTVPKRWLEPASLEHRVEHPTPTDLASIAEARPSEAAAAAKSTRDAGWWAIPREQRVVDWHTAGWASQPRQQRELVVLEPVPGLLEGRKGMLRIARHSPDDAVAAVVSAVRHYSGDGPGASWIGAPTGNCVLQMDLAPDFQHRRATQWYFAVRPDAEAEGTACCHIRAAWMEECPTVQVSGRWAAANRDSQLARVLSA
jgi:hypothetical protein